MYFDLENCLFLSNGEVSVWIYLFEVEAAKRRYWHFTTTFLDPLPPSGGEEHDHHHHHHHDHNMIIMIPCLWVVRRRQIMIFNPVFIILYLWSSQVSLQMLMVNMIIFRWECHDDDGGDNDDDDEEIAEQDVMEVGWSAAHQRPLECISGSRYL